MTTKKKDKLKQSIKSQAIKNPNTKFYFLVLMGIGFGVAGVVWWWQLLVAVSFGWHGQR